MTWPGAGRETQTSGFLISLPLPLRMMGTNGDFWPCRGRPQSWRCDENVMGGECEGRARGRCDGDIVLTLGPDPMPLLEAVSSPGVVAQGFVDALPFRIETLRLHMSTVRTENRLGQAGNWPCPSQLL